MKKNKISICLVFVTLMFLVFFYGCKKENILNIDLENEEYNYFPFKKGDTLTYVNLQNDTILFIVQVKSYEKSYKKRSFTKSSYSDARIYFDIILNNHSETNFNRIFGYLSFSTIANKRNVVSRFEISVIDADFHYYVQSGYFRQGQLQLPEIVNLMNGDFVENQNAFYPQYVRIEHNKGITKFSIAKEVWTLIENN